MQWGRLVIFALLVFLPATGLPSSESEPYTCNGKYKDGSKPDQAALQKILADHAAWIESGAKKDDTRRANLCNADLSWSNLSWSDLSGAQLNSADLHWSTLEGTNLNGAYMRGVKLNGATMNGATMIGTNMLWAKLKGTTLDDATMNGANLYGAKLNWTNLSGANLIRADLSYAKLSNVILSSAKFMNVNLHRATYEPSTSPDNGFLSGIQNLETVVFGKGKHSGFVLLRNSLKEVGLRELERQATYAIEKGKTNHDSSWFKRSTRRLFFEYTANYGRDPMHSLTLLFYLFLLSSLIYFLSIYIEKKLPLHSYLGQPKRHRSGIFRIWLDERIRKDLGSADPELITVGFIKSIGYALYFSLLSAFHIGWRDLNVGNWIARIQPQEYTLRATGWVRTVSGIQSLISIYLLAFWVLTQFGRPFD